MDVPHVRNELAVSYVDHNTVQIGFENADDHDFLLFHAAPRELVGGGVEFFPDSLDVNHD